VDGLGPCLTLDRPTICEFNKQFLLKRGQNSKALQLNRLRAPNDLFCLGNFVVVGTPRERGVRQLGT